MIDHTLDLDDRGVLSMLDALDVSLRVLARRGDGLVGHGSLMRPAARLCFGDVARPEDLRLACDIAAATSFAELAAMSHNMVDYDVRRFASVVGAPA